MNELNGNDPKYIEWYNGTGSELDITGVKIKKDDSKIVYIAPAGTKIPSHGFLVLPMENFFHDRFLIIGDATFPARV